MLYYAISLELPCEDGLYEVPVVDSSVFHLGVLEDLFDLILAQGLIETAHYLAELALGNGAALVCIDGVVP